MLRKMSTVNIYSDLLGAYDVLLRGVNKLLLLLPVELFGVTLFRELRRALGVNIVEFAGILSREVS